jgi:nitrogen fixation protein FixH
LNWLRLWVAELIRGELTSDVELNTKPKNLLGITGSFRIPASEIQDSSTQFAVEGTYRLPVYVP